MGDRANLRFTYSDGGHIHVYSHWGGTDLAKAAQANFKAASSRWTDEGYCSQMILDGLKYSGISTTRDDNSYNILEFDFKKQRARVLDRANWGEKGPLKVWIEWSFPDFTAVPTETLEAWISPYTGKVVEA